jgi:hypothetical protein
LERVQLAQPAPGGCRLLVRLCLLACCGGLLLLLSSRPAEAAERREPGLLDPVRTTLKATAREVDSFAGRATGSGSSTVGQVADAASPAVQRGAPAVLSPVRRAAPPAHPATRPQRRLARAAGTAATPVTRTLARLTELTTGPVAASVLAPVGAALAPIAGPVGGLVPPVLPGGLPAVPGLGGPGNGSPAGTGTQGLAGALARAGDGVAAAPFPPASQTYPARPAADGASSPATRSIRSWPALTGAVSLPGFPTSAELPAGGPDPLSTASGAGFALAALAAALLLPGLRGRGRARPDRSGVLSRSYLPLVSPA